MHAKIETGGHEEGGGRWKEEGEEGGRRRREEEGGGGRGRKKEGGGREEEGRYNQRSIDLIKCHCLDLRGGVENEGEEEESVCERVRYQECNYKECT